MSSNRQVLDTVDPQVRERASEVVNSAKIHKYLNKQIAFSKDDYGYIQDVIDAHELAIVDLWKYAFDKKNPDKKKQFHEICDACFNLLHVMPMPSEPGEKIKHVMKLFVYSYLGEKWEDMKRFLIENQDVWEVHTEKHESWDLRVLSNVYKATLHLIRKSTWQDLSKTAECVADLRDDQKEYEEKFLAEVKFEHKKPAALELAAYYHLAGAVDVLGQYMISGGSARNITARINFHFDAAIGYCQNAGVFELDLLLRMLKMAFAKMVENSIWNITGQINSRATKFIKLITQNQDGKKPVYELLYPQRAAILEQRLLDPALKAIVVNLPTSSGKTIIAEFRILQALNQFHDVKGKIVYVAPTRALVNQITARLRHDLGPDPLNIRVEKMSGAIEIDSFEENLLKSDSFDILVTTPEKLNLLIRHPEKKEFSRRIVLAIIDEAHNISNKTRGLNLEMLISNIQKDCARAHLLLMTPFIPNYEEVARWLDPSNPQSISMELDWWQPNDKVVGLYYAKGSRNDLTTHFQPLVTHSRTLTLKDEIQMGESNSKKFSLNKVRSTKYYLASLVASQLPKNHNVLILGYKIENTWSIAKKLDSILAENHSDDNLDLVSRYIASELGEEFPLVGYVKKGIGVHNAGLPDDVRELMEWLMETGSLKILVATPTISQGMNFPVNAILLTSYSYPREGPMPSMEFWNLVGRTGRIDQRSLGLIGIAVDKAGSEGAKKAAEYVQKQTEELASVLKKMVEDATKTGGKLNLRAHANEPEWSSFLQYVSHMYKQAANLQNFIAEIRINLELTYGFAQLTQEKKGDLIDAVRDYAQRLDQKKELATLSDMTGFAPETIERTISKVNELKIQTSDWNGSSLFSGASKTLSKLAGIMLNEIPEIKKGLSEIKVGGNKITSDSLSGLISAWVSGKDLSEISREFFGGSDPKAMGTCVKAIYGKVANSATWGLAAIQKLPTSGIRPDQLSEEERRRLSNLSSMIFYGVDSDEAVLMRLNNIPRGISKRMGELYKSKNPNFLESTSTQVLDWIKNLDMSQWDSAVPENKRLSGTEYKKIWEKLTGL